MVRRLKCGGDRWLPRPSTFKVITVRGNDGDVMVSNLLDKENGRWCENKVKELLWPVDAECILQIPLCTNWPQDKQCWAFIMNGEYSVRSGYQVLASEECASDSAGRRDGERGFWRAIWQCCVPPRIRMLGWKIARESLPTKGKIAKRGVRMERSCQFCGSGKWSDN